VLLRICRQISCRKKFNIIVDRNKHAVLAVREDHTTTPPTNTIVAVDINSRSDYVLVEGNDFYSSPRLSPRGDKLAYITWELPNMPWDNTKLWMFDRESGSSVLVAGKNESIMQPLWAPDNVFFLFSLFFFFFPFLFSLSLSCSLFRVFLPCSHSLSLVCRFYTL